MLRLHMAINNVAGALAYCSQGWKVGGTAGPNSPPSPSFPPFLSPLFPSLPLPSLALLLPLPYPHLFSLRPTLSSPLPNLPFPSNLLPFPQNQLGWGSAVTSPSGVPGRKSIFVYFLALKTRLATILAAFVRIKMGAFHCFFERVWGSVV